MSDRRHRSTPPALPEGYQYGDARPEPINPEGITFEHEGMIYRLGSPMIFEEDAALRESSKRYVRPAIARAFDQNDSAWRAPHENAAAQLLRRVKLTGDDRPGPAIPNIDAQRTGEETI